MDRAINRTYEEYTPVVEWSHSADASFAKIIVPGFKREEIRVLVDNHGHLRTRGERPLQGNKWSRFQKDLQLPSDCNVDGIRAKFENEALTITLPKKHPSPPQDAPATPATPMTPKPEPRKPSTAPPQKPPPALPEPAKPTVLPPVPSQKFPDRRPSLPRKPSEVPAPARPAPPVPAPAPELESPKKPTEEWVKEEAKKAQAAAEEEKKRMEREARGKMEEDRKMVDEMKKPKEAEGVMGEMEMAHRRRQTTARRGLLVNVAVAAVVLVGITVYVWNNLSAAAGGGGGHGHGDFGNGSFGDEM
ncbi:unnamed protein product [Alopecurus aequalis]